MPEKVMISGGVVSVSLFLIIIGFFYTSDVIKFIRKKYSGNQGTKAGTR